MKQPTLFKSNKARKRTGGFTIAELSVVMALIAIITAMTVSFTVVMNDVTAQNRTQYDFLQDCAVVEDELNDWVALNDVDGAVFTVGQDGALTVVTSGETSTVSIAGSVLSMGSEQAHNLEQVHGVGTIGKITFSTNSPTNTLIKCVMTRIDNEAQSCSFVFSLRIATIEGGS